MKIQLFSDFWESFFRVIQTKKAGGFFFGIGPSGPNNVKAFLLQLASTINLFSNFSLQLPSQTIKVYNKFDNLLYNILEFLNLNLSV